jgi:hypothetical protein
LEGGASKIVGTINIRDVPKDFLDLVKLAATVEQRIKCFLLLSVLRRCGAGACRDVRG